MSGRLLWILQRAGGLVTACFVVGVFFWWAYNNGDINHATLTALFGSTLFKLCATVALVSTLGHAFIGMWAVGTDYLSESVLGGKGLIGKGYLLLIVLAVGIILFCGLAVIW